MAGGIPLPSFSYHLTYFEDLLNTDHNSPAMVVAKKALHATAVNAAAVAVPNFSDIERIEEANKFIATIAINERNKEVKVVEEYCKKLQLVVPNILKQVNLNGPDPILQNPQDFYIQLTSFLNRAKHDLTEYRDALIQAKRNSGLLGKDLATKDRHEYSNFSFVYNLQNDITSLFKKLQGTFIGNTQSEDAFTTELQTWVLRIIQEAHIAESLENNKDFYTVAAMIITDLRHKIQLEYNDYVRTHGYDKTQKMDTIMRPAIQKIAQQYINQLITNDEKYFTDVQKAVKDLSSPTYERLASGVQSILGIQTVNAKQLTSNITVPKKGSRKISQQNKELVENMLSEIHNSNLLEGLDNIKFTIFSKDNGHGNMRELISLLWSEGGSVNAKVRAQAGVDILSATIGFERDSPIKENLLHETLTNLENIITTTTNKNNITREKEIRNIISNLNDMNNQLDEELQRINQIIQTLDENEQLFIFHESLKESTAIETGKGHSLHGRDLSIITAIDTITSGLQSVGLSTPVDRDTLVFLGLNLSSLSAVGASGVNVKQILTDYFSIFAGLLMFDDVVNMAREAYGQIEYSNTNVIHVYKINNIYMTSSMVLSYLATELEKGQNMIMSRAAAKATIQTGGADAVIQNWLENKWRHGALVGKSGYISNYYSMGEWPRVASAIASVTRVNITFLASFISFINNMF